MMTFYEGEMIGFLWTTSRDVPLSKRVTGLYVGMLNV